MARSFGAVSAMAGSGARLVHCCQALLPRPNIATATSELATKLTEPGRRRLLQNQIRTFLWASRQDRFRVQHTASSRQGQKFCSSIGREMGVLVRLEGSPLYYTAFFSGSVRDPARSRRSKAISGDLRRSPGSDENVFETECELSAPGTVRASQLFEKRSGSFFWQEPLEANLFCPPAPLEVFTEPLEA
jgi:hypothetical protein